MKPKPQTRFLLIFPTPHCVPHRHIQDCDIYSTITVFTRKVNSFPLITIFPIPELRHSPAPSYQAGSLSYFPPPSALRLPTSPSLPVSVSPNLPISGSSPRLPCELQNRTKGPKDSRTEELFKSHPRPFSSPKFKISPISPRLTPLMSP